MNFTTGEGSDDTSLRLASLEKALATAKAKSEQDLAEKEQLIQNLHGMLIENAFTSSAFLREKTVLPPDFALASLGKHFAVEYRDGRPILLARDAQGKPIFSQSGQNSNGSQDNFGTYAGPEEAIRLLIEAHPRRAELLKAANPGGGSGARAGGLPGGRVTTLKQLKSPADKAKFIAEHGLAAYKNLAGKA